MTDQAREAFEDWFKKYKQKNVSVIFSDIFDAGIQSVACCVICVWGLDDIVRKREVIKCWNIYSKYHGKIVKPTFCCSHFSPRFREE